MKRCFLLVLPLILNATAIKVPIIVPEEPKASSHIDEVTSAENEQVSADSYHVQPEQADFYTENGGIKVPVRYLLPPKEDTVVYTYPPEPQTEQEDWTPMVQNLPNVESGPQFTEDDESEKDSYVLPEKQDVPEETVKQWFNPKLLSNETESADEQNSNGYENLKHPIIVPSRRLQPPLVNSAPPNTNYAIPIPATDLVPPMIKPLTVFRPKLKKLKRIIPTLSLEMQPPTPEQPNLYKIPTKLYPKKYSKTYKPIPIPINGYQGEEFPKARPVKFIKPVPHDSDDYSDSVESEKRALKYQQAEEKRKYREDEDAKQQQEFVDSAVAEAFSQDPALEQEASETGFNTQEGFVAEADETPPVDENQGPADRTEFRMHGMHGPNSYKFGYDTGRGKNRQFRYEERNNDGHVKGHYGYVDRHGKTQVVNYDAHPEHGFHAEGPFGKA